MECGKPKSQGLSWRGKYVRLNVGGQLYLTSVDTLTKQDGMLRTMCTGEIEPMRDEEGWVLIDRDGTHFAMILNYLRDGNVASLAVASLPQLYAVRQEADFYCLSGLVDLINEELSKRQLCVLDESSSHVIMITSKKQLNHIIINSTKPIIKLMINRHNNKYSYTSSSDEMLMRNMELFDRLSLKLHRKILFLKEITGSEEICCWSFYACGEKLTDISCTSIVYATERKHNKVEFPEVKIYEEILNALLEEDRMVRDSQANDLRVWLNICDSKNVQ